MGCSKRMARCNDDAENALRGQHVNYAFIRAYTQHRQKGSGSGDRSMTADQLRSEVLGLFNFFQHILIPSLPNGMFR